jgi:hypothetical protein
MIKKEKLLIVLSTTTILLFLVVVWLLLDNNKMTDRTSITRDITAGYKLTSPILDYEELLPVKESIIPIGVIDRKVEDLEHADNGAINIRGEKIHEGLGRRLSNLVDMWGIGVKAARKK